MNDKEAWIIDYLKNKTGFKFVDILDEDFVEAYIDKFEVEHQSMTLGASKCKKLSKLLGCMYKKGLLNRFSHGVRSGYNQDYANFKAPKWVYSYELKD